MLVTTLVALLAAAAGPAVDTVIVEGRKIPDAAARKEIRSRASHAIRQNRQHAQMDQIARWRSPVCVDVVGVSREIEARVATRIEAAAREGDVPVATRPCAPNAVVVFAADGAGLIRLLDRKNGELISHTSLAEQQALVASTAPVRWFYRYGSGDALSTAGAAAIGANASQTDGVALPEGGTASGYNNSSLIDTNLSLAVSRAVVIVDVERATGTPLNSVTDYAARVILAPTRFPAQESVYPTVLSLFAGQVDVPQALTAFDRAYIWGLNRLPDRRPAWTQRAALTEMVVRRMRDY